MYVSSTELHVGCCQTMLFYLCHLLALILMNSVIVECRTCHPPGCCLSQWQESRAGFAPCLSILEMLWKIIS